MEVQQNHLLDNLSKFNSLAIIHIRINEMCFVTTGQVGAIRLGISKALQNWEPDLRPALRNGIAFLPFFSIVDTVFFFFFHINFSYETLD